MTDPDTLEALVSAALSPIRGGDAIDDEKLGELLSALKEMKTELAGAEMISRRLAYVLLSVYPHIVGLFGEVSAADEKRLQTFGAKAVQAMLDSLV